MPMRAGGADKLRTLSRGYTAKEIRINLRYRDIYERDLSTTGIWFKLVGTGTGRYCALQCSGWQYHGGR